MVKRLAEDDGYLLVAGERRYRAVQKLGRSTVTAILTDGNVDEIAIVENLQREDLKPLEEAEALARLMQKHGYTQEQVARVVGKGRTTITGLLLLNDLPEAIREQCRTSDIAKSVLIEIGRAKTPEAQLALWEQLRGGGTVRTVRATKKSGAVKDAQAFTTSTKAVAAAKGLLRRLQELGPGELTANRDQYQELVHLRDEIDAILREKSEEA